MKNEADVEAETIRVQPREQPHPALVIGLDYYLENGLMVFTSRFLLGRGYCCDSGCRHCPYQAILVP